MIENYTDKKRSKNALLFRRMIMIKMKIMIHNEDVGAGLYVIIHTNAATPPPTDTRSFHVDIPVH
jgi:hypothetical protein